MISSCPTAPDADPGLVLGRRSRMGEVQTELTEIKQELKEVRSELNQGNSLLTDIKKTLLVMADNQIDAASEYMFWKLTNIKFF